MAAVDRARYTDVIMGRVASQITSLTIVYPTVYSRADQRKHQSSASLAFVRGIHRSPVNSPHKGPVTRKMFPFDDVIMDARNQSINFCFDSIRFLATISIRGSAYIQLYKIPEQNDRHFEEEKYIFLKQKFPYLMQTSLLVNSKGSNWQ